MGAKINGTEIVLSGFVGGSPDGFFSDGFAATHVIDALATVGSDQNITVRLNSPGGIATEGSAIYSALSQHEGEVTVLVEGIAASAASLLAMAADEIVMAPGAIMMIHDPMNITLGNAAAHKKTIEKLEAHATAYAGVYAKRAGITKKEAREIMVAETWYNGDDAVKAGFADKAEKATAKRKTKAQAPMAFAYSAFYRNVPDHLLAHSDVPFPMASAIPEPEDIDMIEKAPATAPEVIEALIEATETVATGAAAPGISDPTPAAEAAVAEVSPAELAAQIVDACTAAGQPALAAGLIRAGASLADAQAQIASAAAITAAVASARKVCPQISASLAQTFISEGKSAVEARAALLDEIVAKQSPELSPQPPAAKESDAQTTRTAVTASWDRVIEKVIARKG